MELKTLFTEKRIRVLLSLKRTNSNIDHFCRVVGMNYSYTHQIIREFRGLGLVNIKRLENQCIFNLTDEGIIVRDMLFKVIHTINDKQKKQEELHREVQTIQSKIQKV